MFCDYSCEKCNCIFTYNKPYGEEMTETLVRKCQAEEQDDDAVCEFKRFLGNSSVVFDVAEGNAGNSANGFESTIGSYKPGKFTPLDRGQAKRRSSWFSNRNGRME